MPGEFSTAVSGWIADVEEVAVELFRASVQDVAEEMVKVGPSVASVGAAINATGRVVGPVPQPGEGGRMPVDTGYLRASLLASTSSMPVMRSESVPAEGQTYSYDPEAVNLVINGAGLEDTIYLGFTAAYAARMNYEGSSIAPGGYLFVETAAQKWEQIVDRNASEILRRAGLT